MKIAINLTRENVGGITSSNLNLINHLYKRDCEFASIELTSRMYMKGASIFRSFDPEIFDHHILNIHHLPFPSIIEKSKNLRDIEHAYAEIIKIIRKILRDTRPDIVLLSGTYYMPWLISIAAKKEKLPIVLWYSGVLAKETSHQPKHIRKIYLAMEKSIVSSASKIIFPSELCKTTVEDDVLKSKIKNGYVIPNPVSSIFTDPAAIDVSTDRRIAAVGRYSKVKNFDRYFELHTELLKEKWRHTASFVTNSDANLEKVPNTIEMLPSMSPEGLKKFYLAHGLIICPSLFETFGNVPMEAACLGIPVLVSDRMGCAEILKKVGLANMVISFDAPINIIAARAKELCGQSILPRQLNALKRILDNNLVSEEILAVLSTVAHKNGKA
ncbi:MAG TPA: glycosyltransferase family 4 protein [Candidatus Paceibacterota bacterium]